MLPMLEMAGPVPAHTPALTVPEALAEFATDDLALPRFHMWTLGCQMNRSDSEEMAGALLAAGCAEADGLESADLIVINTCAIREAAEQKVIGRMGHLARLKEANPALRVVMAGCSVRENNRSTLHRRYPAVDLFLRPDEEPELTARLGLAGATAPGALGKAGALRMTGGLRRESDVHAWLPIIYGCDKTCTYCIVPFSRGPERSRPFDEVVEEARALALAGYREVTLLGQNVNSFGHDLPAEARFADVRGGRTLGRRLDLDGRPDIAALLRAIDGIRTADGVPAIPRLRFVTSHPWDLTDRLIEAIAECPSVCEHLHLPVQSGDDAVLRRMGRQYTVDAYLQLVTRLRAAVPGIVLTTDIIVGFCGETEAHFENTLALLREVRFETVFAAAFSVRPGTPAARLPDDVARPDKKRRLQMLLNAQEAIGLAANQGWVGRRTEVLVDQIRPARPHDHDAGTDIGPRVAGRNRENKLVHLSGAPEMVGRMLNVSVERAGPYSLAGRLLS
jgi:tRNA-2-methylthio-N6-dimethylallyladenosine synthase